MWDFLLIDIKDIVSSVTKEKFTESELDSLADLIVDMGGLMRPVILKKIGFERFEVIDGHLEYYASLKAKEKKPDLETINSFVIEPEVEEIAIKQLQIYPTPVDNPPIPFPDLIKQFQELKLNTQEQIESLQNNYHQEIQSLRDRIENLKPSPKPSIVDVINTYSDQQLIEMGFGKAIAKKILNERTKTPFTSLADAKNRIKTGWKVDELIKFIDSYEKLELRLVWAATGS
jgi:hypothetical protein